MITNKTKIRNFRAKTSIFGKANIQWSKQKCSPNICHSSLQTITIHKRQGARFLISREKYFRGKPKPLQFQKPRRYGMAFADQSTKPRHTWNRAEKNVKKWTPLSYIDSSGNQTNRVKMEGKKCKIDLYFSRSFATVFLLSCLSISRTILDKNLFSFSRYESSQQTLDSIQHNKFVTTFADTISFEIEIEIK